MEPDWNKLQERFRRLEGLAESRFPEEEYFFDITVWATGNFELEVKHGITDTSREKVFLADQDGNIVFEKRERKTESAEKEILDAEIIDSPEGLDLEEWEEKRMK